MSAQMMDQLTAASEGLSTAKLSLFSGHDTTMLPFLRILQQDICTWPPFVASIVFELWRKPQDGASLVRVLYNGKPLQRDVAGLPIATS